VNFSFELFRCDAIKRLGLVEIKQDLAQSEDLGGSALGGKHYRAFDSFRCDAIKRLRLAQVDHELHNRKR
jgi:hypothetical protein